MRFDSFAAFIQMDGHGGYIWAAYGITLLVLAANLWWPRMMRAVFVQEEKRYLDRENIESAGDEQ